MSKIKLLIVSGSFPEIHCGISAHVTQIARRFVQSGLYDVGVLTSADERVNKTLANGYEVYDRIGKWSIWNAGLICREILRLSPEIVHIQNPSVKYCGLQSGTMSVVAWRLKRMAPDIRIVVTQHDIALSKRWWRWRFRSLLSSAEAIIVSNMRDYEAVVDQGISTEKIYRAPVSSHVRFNEFENVDKNTGCKRMGIGQKGICVAFFGFVLPERNVDVLIRAIKLLRCKHNREIHGLILGGAHGQAPLYYDRCRELANRLGLKNHITWTGFATDEQIAHGLACADVFVSLPQRGADMRNTSIITAMLAKLPIVTSENKHFYHDSDLEKLGCICVPPRDVQAVAKAIIDCADEKPDDEFLSRRAAMLDPEKIWSLHININIQAFRGDKPMDIDLSV